MIAIVGRTAVLAFRIDAHIYAKYDELGNVFQINNLPSKKIIKQKFSEDSAIL